MQLPRRALGTEDPQSHGLLRISSRFAGDLLFIIDRRPYEIAVEQAKADVERAKAKLEIASLDVQPATPLVRSQSLTEREFDTRKAAERDAAGQVGSTEAALKQAQLNLEWTEVRALTTGRISDRRVDVGNLITGGQTGATLLTVIVSIDPIHFVFDGSEADFLRYLRLAAARWALQFSLACWGVTLFGLLFTPVFYVLVRAMVGGGKRRQSVQPSRAAGSSASE